MNYQNICESKSLENRMSRNSFTQRIYPRHREGHILYVEDNEEA